ncbi:MAG: UDP-N-acetylmuramoyl-L-alanyl-D-glutamate--2,6-diaminopimelate ligase [Armatimonadetes bacterium]|nr:UDP-N-acetylmuramoyl-L-alanyl-D-glutamate--2,6-diaminopimelate ligase [Armatimonadota bacterium]
MSLEQPRQASLKSLLEAVTVCVTEVASDTAVKGVTHDSRQVRPGYVFVAIRGFRADGADFINDALARGASAVVTERNVSGLPVPVVLVSDARRALAELAAAFWDYPSRRLTLIGVTGTNGKTTTCILCASIAEAAGLKAAALGTLGHLVDGQMHARDRTTEEATDLQPTLASLSGAGVRVAAMEVSSHGLALDRVWKTYFDVGVLTNITQDHLDFHASLEEYAETKARLFTVYPTLAREAGKEMRAAINLDDAYGRDIARRAACEVVGYGLKAADAAVTARDVVCEARGTRLHLVTPMGQADLTMKLVGRFNVENALAAAAAATALGLPIDAIVAGLEAAHPAPGRMERVEAGQDFAIIVDYAHTPDALAKVLTEARHLTRGRLLCVFGCGGDRDPTKRPKMGRTATEIADWTVITSDNPRSEDPGAIIAQIVAGAVEGRYEVEPDRRTAIRRAIGEARPGDIVVIAGKGHETYQILADRTIHFDDREEAAAAVKEVSGTS